MKPLFHPLTNCETSGLKCIFSQAQFSFKLNFSHTVVRVRQVQVIATFGFSSGHRLPIGEEASGGPALGALRLQPRWKAEGHRHPPRVSGDEEILGGFRGVPFRTTLQLE